MKASALVDGSEVAIYREGKDHGGGPIGLVGT